jgi:polar amino acid transport system substrate-binding protein
MVVMKITGKIRWARCLLIIVLLFSLAVSISRAAEPLPQFQIMTETWPPFQFEEEGEIKGFVVDLLVLMLERIGSFQNRDDIRIYPWARAYSHAQNRENTILFSTTRTREREKMFKWVGPIFQDTTVLIARKERNIKIGKAADLKQYRFATIIDDVGEQYLQRYGIPLSKMSRNSDRVATIGMLALKRVDMIIQSWQGFVEDAKSVGHDLDEFEVVFTIDKAHMCFAFHKETPGWIIEKFQMALDALRAQGKVAELKKKYGNILQP